MLKDLLDGLAKLRGHPLIGVQAQDPWRGSPFDREVFLGTVSPPLIHVDPVRVLPRDLQRLIRAPGIANDNLVSPSDALEARANPPLFVKCDYGYRDFLPHLIAQAGSDR
jgi:hypothetical protein